jgi:predicted regulator of Ras-like GTPase activity (Roadblock/LC7/MglB family)
MQAVLNQINSVPGIVGSLVCDDDGRPVAQLFPPLFDAAMIEEAAAVLSESTFGFQNATGAVDLLDFRYQDARIVVRPMPQSFLLLLCTRAVNMQLLAISLNVAIKKLEKLLVARTMAAPAVPLSPPTASPVTTAASGSLPLDRSKGVSLAVQPMKNNASTYWDNMLESISLNRMTSVMISDHYRTGSFKKLKLTNPVNGKSRKFPVYIIKDDAEHLFDGKVVVSLASMENLGVRPGDMVKAEIEIGGGLFGWEGI